MPLPPAGLFAVGFLLALLPRLRPRAVTGGIACGKSSVCRALVQLGCVVVDLDAIAREVVAPGTSGLRAVVAAFGPRILAADGSSIDRTALGDVVFDDRAKRKALERITHPRILRTMLWQVVVGTLKGRVVVLDAPLLYEAGLDRICSAVMCVSASRDTQIERCKRRDSLTAAQAAKRVDSQMPVALKAARARFNIGNDGAALPDGGFESAKAVRGLAARWL
jgi:dephospho-CoA kinase